MYHTIFLHSDCGGEQKMVVDKLVLPELGRHEEEILK
jgi:hypothetical protein